MDSLPRTTPEEKQRLIDSGYEFYAGEDFPRTRDLSYEQLLDLEIVYAGSPEKVGRQLVDLWDQFRFDEFLLIGHYGGRALAGDEDPGTLRQEGAPDAGRRRRRARARPSSSEPPRDLLVSANPIVLRSHRLSTVHRFVDFCS